MEQVWHPKDERRSPALARTIAFVVVALVFVIVGYWLAPTNASPQASSTDDGVTGALVQQANAVRDSRNVQDQSSSSVLDQTETPALSAPELVITPRPPQTPSIAASTPPAILLSAAQQADLLTLLRLTLQLHTVYGQNKTVETAQKITALNTAVQSAHDTVIEQAWSALALCLARACTDNDFLAFIRVVSSEADRAGIASASLVLNLLIAHQYWGSDNTVQLADAITHVDDGVRARNQPDLVTVWQAIVSCNAKCATKNELLFSFMEKIV